MLITYKIFRKFFLSISRSEEIKLDPKMNVLFAWNDPLEERILKWTCAEGEGEHDLMRVSKCVFF